MNYKIIFIIVILFLLWGAYLANTSSSNSTDHIFDNENKTLIIKNPETKETLLTIQQVSVETDLTIMEEIFNITAYENYTFTENQDFKVRWKESNGNNNITKIKWEILENIEYNVTIPDYIEVEKNITISNIQSYIDITDFFNSNLERLDLGGPNAKKKWKVTSTDELVTIGFENQEVITTNPLNITFFWNTTEQISTHIEPKYRDEWRPFLPAGKSIKKDESLIVKLTLYKQAEIETFSIKIIPMFAGVEVTFT